MQKSKILITTMAIPMLLLAGCFGEEKEKESTDKGKDTKEPTEVVQKETQSLSSLAPLIDEKMENVKSFSIVHKITEDGLESASRGDVIKNKNEVVSADIISEGDDYTSQDFRRIILDNEMFFYDETHKIWLVNDIENEDIQGNFNFIKKVKDFELLNADESVTVENNTYKISLKTNDEKSIKDYLKAKTDYPSDLDEFIKVNYMNVLIEVNYQTMLISNITIESSMSVLAEGESLGDIVSVETLTYSNYDKFSDIKLPTLSLDAVRVNDFLDMYGEGFTDEDYQSLIEREQEEGLIFDTPTDVIDDTNVDIGDIDINAPAE